MRAYKVEILIIDHDHVCDSFDNYKELRGVIEDARYPNRCISPLIMDVKEAHIGEWSDEHPLNCDDTLVDAFNRLEWK
jgi:hypothetical protein